jgi:hypothetical protein
LGTGCLTSIALGQENIAIGKDSLNSVTNTSNNIAIGSEALESCISNYNIGIGYLSGRYITSGSNNIAIGFSSMDRQDVGDSNVAIGEESLYYFNNGSGNVALGKKALYGNMSNSGGNHNIGIGSLAGLGVKNGNKNICIGYFAGPTDAMKDYHERLYIDKGRNGTDSFIYGHMDSTNPILAFNAKVGIGKDSPGEHLDVSGNINFTGTLKQDGVEFGGGKFEDGTTSGQIYYNGGNVGIGTTTPRAKLDVYHSKASGSSTSAVTSDNEAIIQELKIRQNVDSWDSITMAHNSYMDSEHQHYNILMREDGGLYLGAETIFLIKTDGSERLRILSNGNVGIGTTSPNYKLEVEMSGGNGGLRVKNTTNSAEAVIWTEPDYASYLYFGANNANKWSISSRASGEGYDLKFYRFNPGALEVMTMDYATGNVGIGTDSPQSQLQIGDFTGTPHLTLAGKNSSATSSGIYFTDNDAGENPINYGMGIQFDSLNNILNIIGDDNGDGTTDKLMTIIRATGNVGIGTTSPIYPLDVATSAMPYTVKGIGNKYFADWGTWSLGQYDWDNNYHATYIFSARFAAGIAVLGNYLVLASDRRIKQNIVDVPDNLSLETLRSIPVRYYEYIDKLERGSNKTIGFIAQEVKELLPEAVVFTSKIIPDETREMQNISWEEIIDGSNNTYKLTTDLNNCSGIKYRFYVSNDISGNDEVMKEVVGNSDNTFTFDEQWNNVFCYGKEVDDFHTLDKQKLFALNFSATQELDRKVIALESENAELKTKNTELENKVATLESELAAIKHHLGLA